MAFRVHTDRLRKGMVIKNDVYSRTGAVLIPVNTPVTKEVLALLTRHFIDYVMVDYQSTASSPADIPSPESVPKIRQKQEEEFLEGGSYGKHSIMGYNLLKDKNIDLKVKQAILTHHERQDGSGFPLKVKTGNINHISRIIAIADTYDTLTMTEPGIKPKSPFWILKHLEDTGYHKYDSNMLMTFISHLTNNFIRHNVRLSNDVIGQIVLINKFNLTRPLVQIGNSFIDLAVRNDLVIKELLD